MPKLSNEKREELKNKMLDFRRFAEEGNKATFKRMSKAERFKVGKQWDRDDLAYNKEHRKHSLTINRCLPVVNQISGSEIQNPRDIKVRNLKGGTATLAGLFTALAKHGLDSNNCQRVKSQMFDEGITTARGWLEGGVDYSEDPINGDLMTRKHDPFMVLLDPNCTKYDINEEKGGAKYVIVDEWVDKEQLEKQYPEKKLQLESIDYTAGGRKSVWTTLISHLFKTSGVGNVRDDYRDDTMSEETPESSRSKYNYRKSTYWWKEYMKGAYLQKVDDPLDFVVLTEKWEIKQAKDRMKAEPGVAKLIEKDREGKQLTVGVLRKTTMTGDVLLEHNEKPFPGKTGSINKIPLFRFSPYFVNGYEFGVVENIIGPQEEVNWARSMVLNLIRLLANAGWKVKSGSKANKDWLAEQGTEDGIVIDQSKFGGKVEKLEQNLLSAGHEYLFQSGTQNINEITNVRLEEPVKDQKQMSGKAIQLKQQSSFTGSAVLFSNYDYTIQLFGEFVIDLIRRMEIYSEEEIMAVVDEEDVIDPELLRQAQGIVIQQIKLMGGQIPEPPEQPNPMLFQYAEPHQQGVMVENYRQGVKLYSQFIEQINQAAIPMAKEILFDMLNSTGIGRYGVKVSLAPMADTFRIIKSIEAFELNKTLIESGHAPLPRRALIESSDIANKEAILEEEPQMQGAMKK
jgi:hypothetical protein